MKQENKEYAERLLKYEYTEEQVKDVLEFRDSCEHMPFEMFTVLFEQKVVERTAKLRKPRNLYVCSEGKIWYLNHFSKTWKWMGKFKDEEDGE